MPVPEFDQFERLQELTNDLHDSRLELGDMVAVEKQQRIRAFEDAEADSVSAADRYADAVVIDVTSDKIRLQAEIAAMETEWEFLMAWMKVSAKVGD